MKATETIFILERQGSPVEAFGSIAAIFDEYTPEELGFSSIRDLWGSVDLVRSVRRGPVKISKVKIKRRKQQKIKDNGKE